MPTLQAQPTLSPEQLHNLDAYWRAANYLSVGQIYLYDNPLLKRPLELSDIKHMLLGHWGTTPGQNFIYAHLNRVIKQQDLDMIYVSGPGHGGPSVVANTYLEGTYSEIYPEISRDEEGLRKLFIQFSFPGGIPSHASPECPGSIHEGVELGYSLSHSFGAVFDNPDLIVACVVGDGEAETGPLATAWHSNKFLNPASDGAVLPILHLNGYKIAKHPAPQWLTMEAAEKHCAEGIKVWDWASNDDGGEPDVVMACCGDVPTLETLAAVSIMREHLPELKIRIVNVVDLMKLQPHSEHPHGLSDAGFDAFFTKDKPVIFAFHAYPSLIHQLTYRRTNHHNIHVRGYKEEGTITTPFDMTVMNELDRFHLVMDTIDRLPRTGDQGLALKQKLANKLVEHRQYICKHGRDMPEIRDWKWSAK